MAAGSDSSGYFFFDWSLAGAVPRATDTLAWTEIDHEFLSPFSAPDHLMAT